MSFSKLKPGEEVYQTSFAFETFTPDVELHALYPEPRKQGRNNVSENIPV